MAFKYRKIYGSLSEINNSNSIGIAGIMASKKNKIYLGNLEAKRDWGYAPEYVEAMWLMLQQEQPDDYVIGTGETHSVKEFLEEAFNYLSLDWQKYVEIDPKYSRPTEVGVLRADSTKARKKLNRSPEISFNDLIRIMVDYDLELIGLDSPRKGKKIIQQKALEWTSSRLAGFSGRTRVLVTSREHQIRTNKIRNGP